jgi:chromate transport protein ChrA
MSTLAEETTPRLTAPSLPLIQRLREVFIAYSPLGFISFGGPGVHVVLLREIFVDKRRWVDTKTFTDLFALGNALPGPGSTQLAFSIAVVKHGVLGGLLGFLLWSLPGAIGMAALAIGIARIPDSLPPIVLALFTGLNAAAVGLIALAAVQLGTASITDGPTLVILWLSASFGICYHAPWMYPTLIACGGIVTLLWDQKWRVERRLRKSKRSREARNDSQAAELVEMDERPNASSSSQASRVDQGQQTEEPLPVGARVPQGEVLTAAESSIRQRLSTTASPNTILPGEGTIVTETNTPLNVVSYKVAAALIFGFVLLLVIPISTRAGLSNAGKAVPRLLDVSYVQHGREAGWWCKGDN